MQLKKIKIVDFKRIQLAEFELTNLNILVGSNGSGKSSIIQAIHLACCAIRQAERVDYKGSTIMIDTLDYVPSENYALLGHNTNWGNKDGSPHSSVEMSFLNELHTVTNITATCTLRSARNAGISVRGSIPQPLQSLLRTNNKFFSAYIPGISGIPNKEEKKSEKVILKACSYGDSNIYLRNALLLLYLRNTQNIHQIESWIGEIALPIKINLRHDEKKDLTIYCNVSVEGVNNGKPLELLGTGYLQLIQIFCYVLLFNSGILLIDEPDIHLHPSVQERLVRVLARVAAERQIKILMTTHSPFMVRGAPSVANVYWVNEGRIETANRSQVELALGWGAFGKKIILVSEDQNTDLLRKIIAQWPGLDRLVTYLPGRGYKRVTTPDQAAEMAEALGGRYKLLIHRDRDSLTDQEVVDIQSAYSAKGATIWFSQLSDVESYFCQGEFLQSLLGCTEAQANQYLDGILERNAQPIRDQFDKQRGAHNEELYATGGSPTNESVWTIFQGRPLKGAKGKYVFNQLKNVVPNNSFRHELILMHVPAVEIAPDLKQVLEILSA